MGTISFETEAILQSAILKLFLRSVRQTRQGWEKEPRSELPMTWSKSCRARDLLFIISFLVARV